MPRFVRTSGPSAPHRPIKIINRAREVWEAQSFAGRDQPNVWVPPFYRGTKSIREGKDRPFQHLALCKVKSRFHSHNKAPSIGPSPCPCPFSFFSVFAFGSRRKQINIIQYNTMILYYTITSCCVQNPSEHYSAAWLCSILYLVSDMGFQYLPPPRARSHFHSVGPCPSSPLPRFLYCPVFLPAPARELFSVGNQQLVT